MKTRTSALAASASAGNIDAALAVDAALAAKKAKKAAARSWALQCPTTWQL